MSTSCGEGPGAALFTAQDARRLDELLARLADACRSDDLDALAPGTPRRLLSLGSRLYARSVELDGVERVGAVDPGSVTPTEVATTCLGMLAAANLEVFELTLWGGALSTKF